MKNEEHLNQLAEYVIEVLKSTGMEMSMRELKENIRNRFNCPINDVNGVVLFLIKQGKIKEIRKYSLEG